METLKKKLIQYFLGDCAASDVQAALPKEQEQEEEFLVWASQHALLPAAFPLVFPHHPPMELVDLDHPDRDTVRMQQARYQVRRELILDHLKQFYDHAKATGLPLLLLKGFTYEQWYPNQQQRFTGDIDFIVDEATAWELTPLARSIGLEQSGFSIFRNDHGNVKGYFKLGYEHPAAKYRMYGVEFNLGGFVITDMTCIDLEVLMENAQEHFLVDRVQVLIPAIEKQLLVLVGEHVTRDTVRLSDLLDLLILLNQANGEELAKFEQLLEKYSLICEFKRMVASFAQFPIESQILDNPLIASLFARYQTVDLHDSEWKRIFVEHVYRYLLHRTDRETATRQTLYYARRYKLGMRMEQQEETSAVETRLQQIGDQYPTTRAHYEEGHYTMFYLASEAITGAWEWVEQNGHHFVITPCGIYWATKEGLEPEETYDEIDEIVGQLVANVSN